MQKVRTRYAPSPTGYLHIGGAWMAFFNWLFARSQTGAFIRRIEDTDGPRTTEKYERAIREDFHWLGLDWEEGPDVGGPAGPYRQTERSHLYRQYAQTLLDRGAAYHCYCTPEELEAERQRARVAKQPYRYSGRCRNLTPEQRAEFERQGRRPTIRLRIHDDGETIVVNDLVRGRVEFDPEHLDDHIIVRSDGSPLYNFANVVDDHTMAITHVIRGIEHLSNTPKQWIMYQALGWEPPQVPHLSIRQVVEVLGDRIKVGRDILTYGDFFFTDAVTYEPDAVKKYFSQKTVATTLAQLRDRVAKVDRLDAATVETIIRTMASELRIESREIIHPARVALTGKTAGPGLFELTALLGRDRVVKRLESAVEWIRRLPDSSGV